VEGNELAVRPTPRVKHTLLRAAQLAQERGHSYLGTEHLLLALLDDEDGIAGAVLKRQGGAASIRQELEEIMASPGYQTPSARRVIRVQIRKPE